MSAIPESTPIVTLVPGSVTYYAASMTPWPFMVEEGYRPHTEVEIRLGQSRYGGPVMDLPPGLAPPEGFRFAAQIDLSEVGPLDVTGLLPTSGHLIVFADIRTDAGIVVHAEVEWSDLVRHVVPHEDNFYAGVLVAGAHADREHWSERFYEDLVDLDDGRIGSVVEWDSFGGGHRSKMLGWPVHCQWSQGEIEDVVRSDRVVLVQFGEGDRGDPRFNDEGVFSVLLSRDDLAARRFDRCEVMWSQS
ncbi:MAG: DUF1963 domain-containing protein [Bacteroidota bacterium]